MPVHVQRPTRIAAAGNKPKLIDEYVGRVNSKTEALSIAHMRSPGGWVEPGQTPAFDEYTESPKSYVEIALEHDFLVRVKPWERAVLARHDMSFDPDELEAARRSHTFFSKEASMPGGSAGGGGCGCN